MFVELLVLVLEIVESVAGVIEVHVEELESVTLVQLRDNLAH